MESKEEFLTELKNLKSNETMMLLTPSFHYNDPEFEEFLDVNFKGARSVELLNFNKLTYTKLVSYFATNELKARLAITFTSESKKKGFSGEFEETCRKFSENYQCISSDPSSNDSGSAVAVLRNKTAPENVFAATLASINIVAILVPGEDPKNNVM